MQIAQQNLTRASLPTLADLSALTPLAMAWHLRRTGGDAAFCFAQAMHEGSAWANAGWGDYWADVMRLV